jgi:hypothetical protein
MSREIHGRGASSTQVLSNDRAMLSNLSKVPTAKLRNPVRVSPKSYSLKATPGPTERGHDQEGGRRMWW